MLSFSPLGDDFAPRSVEKPIRVCGFFLIYADRMSDCAMPCQTRTLYIIFLANEVFTAQAVVSFLVEAWQANH